MCDNVGQTSQGRVRGYPNQIRLDSGRLGISMLGMDLDFWEYVTFAALFILGIGALIAVVFVLGLSTLYSWEAASLMRCPSWSFSSSSCGWFF
jgi:hypothetical protein